MGASASRPNYQTAFTKKENERLQKRFEKASNGRDKASIRALQHENELESLFATRALHLFDTDRDGCLSLDEFRNALDLLGSLNTEEDQMQFIFKMVDVDGSGTVSAEEVREVLESFAGRALSNTQLQQVVRSLMDMHDEDGDGELSFEEFKRLLHACADVAKSS